MNRPGRRIIDMQRLNPNWDFAADHGQSTKPGLEPANADKRGSIVICQCCLNLIQKDPVNICENSKELSFLGFGFPLFYNMLQFCIINLFILILTESASLLYLSLSQGCEYNSTHSSRELAEAGGIPYKCVAVFIRISRVSSHTSDFDVLIRILSFVGQLFLLLYFRDNQRKLAAYHVERSLKLSDFTIIFKNLPKVKGIQKSIREFLTKEFKTKIHIQKIILFPKIDEFLQKEQIKLQIIDKKRKIMKQDQQNSRVKELIKQIDLQIERINEQMMNICQQIKKKDEEDILYGEKAVVILKSEKEKVAVLQEFQEMDKSVMSMYFHWMGDEVSMKSAPAPQEIIWENFDYPKNQRWFKILIGWALSILFLGSVTVIFYFLIRAKGQRLDTSIHKDGYTEQEYNEAVAIVFIAIVLIQLFNKFLMKIVLHAICGLEKPQTTSQYEFSYAFKYTLGMFFTTAVMTLAVEAIQFNNYAGQYGVVEQETIMFFFSAFFVNLLWLIHPQYYLKKLKRYMNYGREDMTQKEANQLMEDFPYDIGKRFAEIIQIMWFTYLYSSLIPIGAPLSFIGFVIYYWLDKYNLLRRSSISNTIQSKLPLLAIKLMEVTLFWKPLGELIFDYQLRGGQVLPSTIVMLCVALIYLILPWNKILQLVFEEKFRIKEDEYEKSASKLGNNYTIVHPVRRHIELDSQLLKRQKQTGKVFMLNEYNNENPSLFTSHNEINLVVDEKISE